MSGAKNGDKQYISFNPENGYPAGEKTFYECMGCGEVFLSMPDDSVVCKCRNVAIDIDYGRVSIKDHKKLKVFYKE